MASWLLHREAVKRGGNAWLAIGCGLVLGGCFYIDPINRRPKVMPVQRQCSGADPSAPCDLDDLHHGDAVQLAAAFNDQDGDEALATLQWRITACDDAAKDKDCDGDRLYEGADASPSFVVRHVLEVTGGPVRQVVVELDVFDERGASSSESQILIVHDGPTLALRRSAAVYAVGSPIDLFATAGDPDDESQGTSPPDVALAWAALAPSGQSPPPLVDLEVPADTADRGHITVGERLVPSEVGDWDVRVRATNARDMTNEKHLRFSVGPAAAGGAVPGGAVPGRVE